MWVTFTAVAQETAPVINCFINGAEYQDRFNYHAQTISISDTIKITYTHDSGNKLLFDTVFLCINVSEELMSQSYATFDRSDTSGKEVHIPIVVRGASEIVIPLSEFVYSKRYLNTAIVSDNLDQYVKGKHEITKEKIRITLTNLHSPDKRISYPLYDFIFRFYLSDF
jgi:hypothetical protein